MTFFHMTEYIIWNQTVKMALLTFIVVVYSLALIWYAMLKALGVRSLNYYAPFCNMFIYFFASHSLLIFFAPSGWIYMLFHGFIVVAVVVYVYYNTLGCVVVCNVHNIKMAKKNITKNYGFLVNQEKWLKIWWKYVTCFSYYMRTKFKCMQFLAMNFFLLLFLSFFSRSVLLLDLFWLYSCCSHVRHLYIYSVTRCRLIHHLVISQQFMTFLGTFRFIEREVGEWISFIC